MFNKVIIGVDRLHPARDAIAVAKALAPGAPMLLAAVVARPRLAVSVRESYERALRDDAYAMLEAVRRDVGLPDADLHVIVAPTPAAGLKEYAVGHRADLIVIGAARHSVVGRIVLGDVAHGVLTGAPCPVLVAPRNLATGDVATAVFGTAFDGSPEATHALALATRLAVEHHARLEVIQALNVGDLPMEWGFETREYLDRVVQPAQEGLDALVAGLCVPARAAVVEGQTHKVLADASRHVDLMVCGSRGWGPAARLAFGSTAERLMHGAYSPVLVVPRGAEASLGLVEGATTVGANPVRAATRRVRTAPGTRA